ncbi:MAG: Phosphoribosyl 1,2-cyclic phosphodiesterase [Alphaproteobacteria bacterium ADurb.Bin438]|nr:MAG: Phosphoribosyl 1,2-cyclic phosphodiesterase [Alphaproteobacteria bacterium ADurb.Bin438]
MKITILGSGAACGTPNACNILKTDIDLNNPKNVRMRSSAFFETDKGNFMVECGPDFRHQTCRFNVNNFENIFLSHQHFDHIGGIWELVRVSSNIGKEINIFGNEETIKEVETCFYYMFKQGKEGFVKLNIIEPYKELKLPNTDISLMPLNFTHKDKEILGFKLDNMVYTPDFCEFNDETSKYLYDLDLWIFELTSLQDIKRGHNYLSQTFDLVDKYNPKKVVLNHLSEEIDFDKVSKMIPLNSKLAYDGMEIKI